MKELILVIGIISLMISLLYRLFFSVISSAEGFKGNSKKSLKYYSKSVNWVSGSFLLIACICLYLWKILEG
jgi:hypothetical protein